MRRGLFHTKSSQGHEDFLRQHTLNYLTTKSGERGELTRLVTDPPNYHILPSMLR